MCPNYDIAQFPENNPRKPNFRLKVGRIEENY